MKKGIILFDIGLLISAIIGIFLSFFVIHNDVQVVRVVSNSMAPYIHRGDSLIFKSEPASRISKGQILLLPTIDGSGNSYAHRVIALHATQESRVEIRTQGDANPAPDNWAVTITSAKVPVYLATIPMKSIPLVKLNQLTLFSFVIVLVSALTLGIFRRKRQFTNE